MASALSLKQMHGTWEGSQGRKRQQLDGRLTGLHPRGDGSRPSAKLGDLSRLRRRAASTRDAPVHGTLKLLANGSCPFSRTPGVSHIFCLVWTYDIAQGAR